MEREPHRTRQKGSTLKNAVAKSPAQMRCGLICSLWWISMAPANHLFFLKSRRILFFSAFTATAVSSSQSQKQVPSFLDFLCRSKTLPSL